MQVLDNDGVLMTKALGAVKPKTATSRSSMRRLMEPMQLAKWCVPSIAIQWRTTQQAFQATLIRSSFTPVQIRLHPASKMVPINVLSISQLQKATLSHCHPATTSVRSITPISSVSRRATNPNQSIFATMWGFSKKRVVWLPMFICS